MGSLEITKEFVIFYTSFKLSSKFNRCLWYDLIIDSLPVGKLNHYCHYSFKEHAPTCSSNCKDLCGSAALKQISKVTDSEYLSTLTPVAFELGCS